MSKSIPNERSWIGFLESPDDWSAVAAYTIGDKSTLIPTAAEVASAVDLTKLIVGLNAGVTGQAVPTPAFDSRFVRSVGGTSEGAFQLDAYRDSNTGEDDAWNALARATFGFFFISRFGGSGTGRLPIADDIIEVWPTEVNSRTMQQMASNTVQMMTVVCAVHEEPNEDATVS